MNRPPLLILALGLILWSLILPDPWWQVALAAAAGITVAITVHIIRTIRATRRDHA